MTKPSAPNAFPWALSIFPLLELGCFVAGAALLERSPALSVALLLLASLNLSFGIHIFFHECVHRSSHYSALFKSAASIMIGLPFDGYRVHHYNHHAFENGPRDFSSTWIYRGDQKIAHSVWSYTFGWPRQLVASVKSRIPFGATPERADRIKKRIPSQKSALLLAMLAMLLIDWKILLLYLALIYLGWAFTSLHNYGQHPPIEGAGVSTYAGKRYNALFFNNGLHWEHHARPAVPWNALTPDAGSPRIRSAHILNPLLPSTPQEITNA